jgi:hypothetical protein
MALTPGLNSLEAMFRKLERELVRTYHERNLTHKADHFYNFCISAHSIRDYALERLGKILPADQQPLNELWAKNMALVAVSEIANTAKHFQLRHDKKRLPRTTKTKRVRQGLTTNALFFTNESGELETIKMIGVPTYVIEVDGGRKFELYEFMDTVVTYWRAELKGYGIQVRRQSFRQLHGSK